MKRLLIAAVLLLAGCAANLGFQIGSTGKSATAPSVGPGGSFSSAGVGAQYGQDCRKPVENPASLRCY